MRLSFLIPFRDVEGVRSPAKDWIVARWRHFYPDAEFVIAPDDGVDPFCKSMAVNAAARQATGDIFAILDADTWLEAPPRTEPDPYLDIALALIARGAPWVIPARRSLRLTREFSAQVMGYDPTGILPPVVNRRSSVEQAGRVAGFLHVLSRSAFEAVGGMDERFRGWGGEDTSFMRSVDVVVGKHRWLPGTVVSLWHPRPRRHGRYWEGQTDAHEQARNQLGQRYTAAGFRRERLIALLREPGGPLAQAVAA